MATGVGTVISCDSLDEWNKQLQRAKDSKQLVVIDFTATWCGPCKMIAPYFVELAEKWQNVMFLKVDVDELQTVATDWDVRAMPTFLFLKDGAIVDKIVGAQRSELERKIEKHAPATAPDTASA